MKSRLETIYYATDDVKIEYYVEPDGIKIKSVECNLPYSSIVLPVSINGVNVVTLLMGFAEKLCAEGLYLPPYLNEIEEFAFQNSCIKRLIIVSELRTVSVTSFNNMPFLEKIVLPPNQMLMPCKAVFRGCRKLKEIEFTSPEIVIDRRNTKGILSGGADNFIFNARQCYSAYIGKYIEDEILEHFKFGFDTEIIYEK